MSTNINEKEEILSRLSLSDAIFARYPYVIIPSDKSLSIIIQKEVSVNVKYKHVRFTNINGIWLIPAKAVEKANAFAEKESLRIQSYEEFILQHYQKRA